MGTKRSKVKRAPAAKKRKVAPRATRRRRAKKVEPGATPAYLLGVEIENVRCFGPKQRLNLATKHGTPAPWTLIFGDNGSGKTTLLQAICSLASTLQDDREVPSFIRYNWWPHRKDSKDAVISADVLMRPKKVERFSVRFPKRARNAMPAPVWDFNGAGAIQYFGYGASRRHGNEADSGRKPLESSGDESLFVDDAQLLNAEEWFLQMSHFGPSRKKLREARAAERVRDFLKSVLIDISAIRIGTRNGHSLMEFKTPYGWVPMRDLSVGYRTLIAWLVDFTRRMQVVYASSGSPLAQPVVVCIDEIDLHLHQRWQRMVMKFLSDLFPKAQFVATAHSRQVLQSAPRGTNLVVLRRNKDWAEIHHDADEILEGIR
jgi:energy-coupling factor transporter ATP-binding protein EcfA2